MHKNNNYKFKFSFVMPIYKVEEYLEETIQNIINQDFNFKDIEIIFVNDGSPDNSEQICLKYLKDYPNNIKYIKQANSGVSTARNKGIANASGKYISLLDSDDLLSSDTLKKVYRFFEDSKEPLDVVSIKIKFFEAQRGNHMLNYKYTKDSVVDLNKEYNYIQMSSASAFFRSETLKKYKFKEGMKFAEDARLLSEILENKKRLGVLKDPVYYYRKRKTGTSALASTADSTDWYNKTLKLFHDYLINKYSKNNNISMYLQFVLMYELQWRFKVPKNKVLNSEELALYKKHIKGFLNYIDDDIILAQKNITIQTKMYILSLKHGVNVFKKAKVKSGNVYLNDKKIYSYKSYGQAVNIDIINSKDGSIEIDGFLEGILFGDAKLKAHQNNKELDVKKIDRVNQEVKFMDEVMYSKYCFNLKVKLYASNIDFNLVQGEYRKKIPIHTTRHAKLSKDVGRSFRVIDRFILSKHPKCLEIDDYGMLKHIRKEIIYDLSLLKNKKIRSMLIRCLKFATKPFYRKDVWLISDRVFAAGDNGEALFRYLNNNKQKGVRPYFAISKHSQEYEKLKKYGKVVNYGSLKYKALFLNSNKVISSHADDFVMNAFGARSENISDIYDFKFIFLQHGIIKDDMSSWLNKYDKNFGMFVTSTSREYESVVRGSYGYDESVVKLTGLPRYDYLKDKSINKLIIAPTWRAGLAATTDNSSGKRLYDRNFTTTNYYKFFNNLINDPKILEALSDKGYVGEFYLHPSFSSQIKDFKGNDYVKVVKIPYNYKKAFAEGALLVTDYSSVAFDFAYMYKPVIYAQFDKEELFKSHIYDKGYFSYEKDGLGPVVETYKDTVNEITAYIKNSYKLHPLYKKRIDNFFKYKDTNNCSRVVAEILKKS